MSDITIPADTAKELAEFLMRKGLGRHHHLVLLLDPPAPSLRDELAALMPDVYRDYGATKIVYDKTVDAIRAAVRKHVEALPMSSLYGIDRLDRDDVRRLLGAGE